MQRREISPDYSFIIFTHHMQLVTYLGRSGHQVSLNDPSPDLASPLQDTSNGIHFDLEATLRSRDRRSMVTLTFGGRRIHSPMRINERMTMVRLVSCWSRSCWSLLEMERYHLLMTQLGHSTTNRPNNSRNNTLHLRFL